MTDETTPAPAEPAAPSAPAETEPAKTTEPEAQATEPEAETTEGDESSQEERKRPSRSERQKRRMTAIATELENLKAEIAKRDQAPSKADTAPNEADFNGDVFAYTAARAAFEARQAVREEFREQRQQEQSKEQAKRQVEASEEFFDRAEEIKTRIPDFDKTIEKFYGDGGRLSPTVQEEIRESEKGPALVYHLAKNPHIAAELNSLSPRDVAREIGRLEARLASPAPKKQTAAPAPLNTPKGGSATPVSERTGPDDMNAFAKWLRKGTEDKRR